MEKRRPEFLINGVEPLLNRKSDIFRTLKNQHKIGLFRTLKQYNEASILISRFKSVVFSVLRKGPY